MGLTAGETSWKPRPVNVGTQKQKLSKLKQKRLKRRRETREKESVIEPWDNFKQPNMCEIGAVKGKLGQGEIPNI